MTNIEQEQLIAFGLFWVWKASIIFRWLLLDCWPKTTLPFQSISWHVDLECWNTADGGSHLLMVFLCSVIPFVNSFPVSPIYSAWQSLHFIEYITPSLSVSSRLSFTQHNSDRRACAGLCASFVPCAWRTLPTRSYAPLVHGTEIYISVIFFISVYISAILRHALFIHVQISYIYIATYSTDTIRCKVMHFHVLLILNKTATELYYMVCVFLHHITLNNKSKSLTLIADLNKTYTEIANNI